MNQNPSWQSVVVAVAIIALVGVMFVTTLLHTTSVGDFLQVWGGIGTIVGVVAGAIPSYFFRQQTKAADAERQLVRAQLEAIAVNSPEAIATAASVVPTAFPGGTTGFVPGSVG